MTPKTDDLVKLLDVVEITIHRLSDYKAKAYASYKEAPTKELAAVYDREIEDTEKELLAIKLVRDKGYAAEWIRTQPPQDGGWRSTADWTDDETFGDRVLVAWNDGTVEEMGWSSVTEYEQQNGINTFVTHWMPFPAPPSPTTREDGWR